MLFVMCQRVKKCPRWGWGDSPVCRPLYLCTSASASRCHSPDTCSFRRPPWCSRQNTSTLPRPRTGTPPPAPPRWPHGGAGRRTPLHNSPNGTTYGLLTAPSWSWSAQFICIYTCFFCFYFPLNSGVSYKLFWLKKKCLPHMNIKFNL